VKPGDHVIPLFTRRNAAQCKSCLSQKTNLCTAIPATQGKGLMPDGTKPLVNKASRSSTTWAARLRELYRAPESPSPKIRQDAPFDKSCYIGCA